MSIDPYRGVARCYDKVFEPMNRGLRRMGRRMFTPRGGMSVLDIGCGTGVHLSMYQSFGCDLHGIDTSPSMLRVARTRLNDVADLRLANATRIPYDRGTFDLVICMLTLHEMDAAVRGRAIGEMRRVLKSDGRILFIDFHVGSPVPVNGWFSKLVIVLSEIVAGRTHFRNYRHFISIGGLPSLIAEGNLSVEKERVVGGGTLDLYLLTHRK